MIGFKIQNDSHIPIYVQLKNSFVQAIQSGQFAPLTKLPNVTQIARDAGVSLRTADLALQELIRDGLCFRRPKKGTFVGPSTGCTRQSICGIWTGFDIKTPRMYPMPFVFYHGIVETAAEIGSETVLISGDPRLVMQRYDRSNEFDFKGLLVFDEDKFDSMTALAGAFPEKRFIFLNYFMEKFDRMPDNMTAVINDDFGGAYHLAEHFIEAQAERFMVLSMALPPADLTYRERVRGFKQAIADYSVFLDPIDDLELEQSTLSQYQREMAFRAVKKALRSGRSPNAILCTNDYLADGARKAIRSEKHGAHVAGFDFLSQHLSVQGNFTTMQVPYLEMGNRALRILNGNLKEHEKIIKLSPKLITNVTGDDINA